MSINRSKVRVKNKLLFVIVTIVLNLTSHLKYYALFIKFCVHFKPLVKLSTWRITNYHSYAHIYGNKYPCMAINYYCSYAGREDI